MAKVAQFIKDVEAALAAIHEDASMLLDADADIRAEAVQAVGGKYQAGKLDRLIRPAILEASPVFCDDLSNESLHTLYSEIKTRVCLLTRKTNEI